ncbi:hypothetical protein D1872_286930 [compost metagenome]
MQSGQRIAFHAFFQHAFSEFRVQNVVVRKLQHAFAGGQRERLAVGEQVNVGIDQPWHDIFARKADHFIMGGDVHFVFFADLLNASVFIDQNGHVFGQTLMLVAVDYIAVGERIGLCHHKILLECDV